jgi:manganese transport protein
VLLWAVILSCLIKFFLQVEIGRYCLVNRCTTMEALSACPGPRLGRLSWLPLAYMAAYTISLASAIGIIGGLAGLMQRLAPITDDAASGVRYWAVLVVAAAGLLLSSSAYHRLEKSVSLMVGGFCVSVLVALVLIQGTDYRITGRDVLSGLRGSLGDQPRLAAYALISLMGALGTTANELFMYPYWLLEKGYGADIPAQRGGARLATAKRWIRGLYLDASFATILATAVTVAFYLLGAAILHRRGLEPQGPAVVEQISEVFTQTYGRWSYALYVGGAFCALFSTVVVVAAATGRMWGDLLTVLGFVERRQVAALSKIHRTVQLAYLAGMLAAVLLLNEAPAKLVIFGQFFAAVVNTPLMMFGICWLSFRTEPGLRMSRWTAAALIVSVAIVTSCVIGGTAIERGWLGTNSSGVK